MDMPGNQAEISEKQIQAVADKSGRDHWEIRAAVNKGLIPPAVQHGLGKGRGSRWAYPVGTDVTLKAVFDLQDRGYRGSALRFALWWDNLMPFSDAVPKYIADVFGTPLKDCTYQLARTRPTSSSEWTAWSAELDEEGITENTAKFGQVLQTKLDLALTDSVTSALHATLVEIDPEANLSVAGTTKIVRALTTTAMRVLPGGDRMAKSFGFLFNYLSPEHDTPLVDKATLWLHNPGWVQELISYVKSARSEGFDIARTLLKDNERFKAIIGVVTSVAKRVAERARTTSKWQASRIGPWQFPETAVRAMATGYLVGIAKWVQLNRTNGPRVGAEVNPT